MIKKILLFIDEVLVWGIRNVNKFHLYILKKNSNKKGKYKFLTANDNAENIEEHSKALNEALEDEKVKNIAISGSYGSGKSSFIKTFEKQNSQYRFLDISLAKFNSNNKKEPDLSLIEKSILEQMFYKVKNKTIPQSRLNKNR
jgi:ABC-type transport system involved in cytochrome bd biosynthesis fused ATPase/permease subunit